MELFQAHRILRNRNQDDRFFCQVREFRKGGPGNRLEAPSLNGSALVLRTVASGSSSRRFLGGSGAPRAGRNRALSSEMVASQGRMELSGYSVAAVQVAGG